MKRLTAIILIFVMLLSLAACSAEKKEVRGTVQTAPTEAEPEFSVGSTTGNTYTNKFLGVTLALGNEWHFATDEEIREINQMAQDMVGEEYAKNMQNQDSFQDMYASNLVTGATFNVTVSNMGAMGGILVSEEMVAEQSVEELKKALGAIGVEDITVEQTKIQFAGKEHEALNVHGTMSGVDLFETLVLVKRGGYMGNFAAASFVDNTTMDVLNAVEAVK